MFPHLTEYLNANHLPVTVVKVVITALSKHFVDYFSDVNTDAWDWVLCSSSYM